MKKTLIIATGLICLIAFAVISQASEKKKTPAIKEKILHTATVSLKGTDLDSQISGTASFIEQKYGLRLDVHLHDQYMSFATETEAELLQISKSERCLRRKVSLMSRKEVMFDAESLLPLDNLPVELIEELEAGKRPLANVLSDQGLILSRANLTVAFVKDEGFYDQCWARRSVLSSEAGAKALVTEVFHSAIWRKLNYLQSAR